MVQYYFDGPEVEVKIKPHGNAKSNTPFFRTSQSAKKMHKELASKGMPKDVVHQATQSVGGEVGARGISCLPRNRQQIANYRRAGNKKDSNVLYSIMLESKLTQGTNEAFIRDVKAAPDPQCIMFFDWQLADMERFVANGQGILSVDPTYNLGEFYVTPTTFSHLMLEDVITKKHPSLLGPVLVHQRMDFATFNYFSSSLIGFNKKLRNVHAFGTDGQDSIIDAFSHSFPSAVQLRCFIHFKKNIVEKLKEYGIPRKVLQEYVDDIFGCYRGSTYMEGLVDCSSEAEFHEKFTKCKTIWDIREGPYAPSSGPRFYDYFQRYKSGTFSHSMLKSLRESVGLGSPPSIYTTNASESINAMMKRKVNYKESEWPRFCKEIEDLVKEQREEVIRALSGRGQYRLLSNYSHYSISASVWAKMRPSQRREVVVKFDKASLKKPQVHTGSASSVGVVDQVSVSGQSSTKQLSVTAADSGITKISLSTLEQIWSKAENLINGENAIAPAPGNDSSTKMVMSYSSQIPHLVRKATNGQYKCDSNCLNWTSSGLCSHSLAVAELSNDLSSFLNWYNLSASQPNITTLAVSGLPAGRGRKGGAAKRTRNRNDKKTPEICIPRPVFQSVVSSGREALQSPPNTMPTVSSATPTLPPTPLISSPSVVNSAIVGQITLSSGISQIGPSTTVTVSSPTPPTPSAVQPNTNPFYVRFLQGNIRVCQGCRSTLRLSDGSIPAPPFNLVMARAERRSFRDKFGTLITPQKEQPSHYHLRLDCVRAVEPGFVGLALCIPQDILPLLNNIHREYLRLVFGLNF